MMQSIQYSLMNPTGNRTILVNTTVPIKKQPVTAAKLMQLEPTAEQVGFLLQSEGCDVSLRMAGGEFCGNAAMSAAVSCGIKRRLNQGKLIVGISGAERPVNVSIFKIKENMWEGTVEMPQPDWIEPVAFSCGQTFPVVSFPGISHVILNEPIPASDAEKLAVSFCRELGSKALGLMFLNEKQTVLTPLVYVPAADTMFWESTCASGTTAVGAWLAHETKHDLSAALNQPGGILEICANTNGSLFLKGHVSFVHEKRVLIEV